jgi:hypothetical protein
VLSDLSRRVVTPKSEELIASAFRHDGHTNAEAFFMEGMTDQAGCRHDQIKEIIQRRDFIAEQPEAEIDPGGAYHVTVWLKSAPNAGPWSKDETATTR